MKKIFFTLFTSLIFFGCEDVVDIETPSEPPRLIVNGILRVDENEPIIPVEIRVSQTNNFFEETPVTSLENVVIVRETFNEDGAIIQTGFSNLTDLDKGSGIYVPDPSFMTDQNIPTSILSDDVRFTLLLTHEGRRYAAATRYVKAVPIDTIEQGTETIFDEDSKELIVSFTDNPDKDNFYVFDFDFGEFLVTDDQFYQGKPFTFSYFYNKKLEVGQELKISILGADQSFYNYVNLLVEQTQNNLGVFETPAATARGNVFDITGLDNIDVVDNLNRPQDFPLGYFAVVESFEQTFVIE